MPTMNIGAAASMRMRRRRALGAMVFCAAMSGAVHAAELLPGPSTRSDQNTARLLRQTQAYVLEQPGKPAQPEWSAQIGAAYEWDAVPAGHSATTPFLVNYAPGNWYFEISGDGYTRSVVDGVRGSGLADASLVASYLFGYGIAKGSAKDPKYALVPELDVTLPTHGEVGSRRASLAGRLAFSYQIERWTWTLKGGLGHDGEAPASGASRDTASLAAKTQYNWSAATYAVASVKRSIRSGADGKTQLHAELDFPLHHWTADDTVHKLTGTVGYGHLMASGQRGDALELDLVYAF